MKKILIALLVLMSALPVADAQRRNLTRNIGEENAMRVVVQNHGQPIRVKNPLDQRLMASNLAATILYPGAAEFHSMRIWTRKDGKTLKVSMMDADLANGFVWCVFQGQTHRINISDLIPADQEFIRRTWQTKEIALIYRKSYQIRDNNTRAY